MINNATTKQLLGFSLNTLLFHFKAIAENETFTKPIIIIHTTSFIYFICIHYIIVVAKLS